MNLNLSVILTWVFLNCLLVSNAMAMESSLRVDAPLEESRLRVSVGYMPWVGLNSSPSVLAFGGGLMAEASYQLGVNSNFLVGLAGGSLSGENAIPSGREKFNVAFVQPTLMYRRMPGSVHPIMALGVGPLFWNQNAIFSARLRMGMDIDLFGPVALGIEPINVMVDASRRVSWTPQLNLVATF